MIAGIRRFAVVFIILLLMTSPVSYSEVVDKIVAVVNDEPITKSELDSLLAPIYDQYKSVYKGKEFVKKINEARTNILNQLIEDKLVAQEAKRLGVEVREDEIDARIDEIKQKFASEKEFREYMDSQGMTMTKLRNRIKEQISIRKLQHYEIQQKIIITPAQVEEYYNRHLEDFSTKEKVKVRTIMLRKKSLSDKELTESGVAEYNEKIYERAKRILEELKEGASFADYAKEYSEGQNKEKGGDLGFIQRGDMIKPFDDVIFSLPVGGISDVVESPIGYHIFLVEAKQAKKVKPISEVKGEIRNILFQQKAEERFKKWMSELKEKAYISIK